MNGITYIGNASTLIEIDGGPILTDPWFTDRFLFLKRRRPPAPLSSTMKNPAIVSISHGHPDHFSRKSLMSLSREATVIAPDNLSRKILGCGFKDVRGMKERDKTIAGAVEITAIPAPHRQAKCLGYLFRSSKTVYFSGDLAPSSRYRRIFEHFPPIDCAILPVGGFALGPSWLRNHVSLTELAEIVAFIRPSVVIPVHWGHNPDFPLMERYEGTGEKFKCLLGEALPEVSTAVLAEGETYHFS